MGSTSSLFFPTVKSCIRENLTALHDGLQHPGASYQFRHRHEFIQSHDDSGTGMILTLPDLKEAAVTEWLVLG